MANNSAWTEPVVIDSTNKPQYPYNNISQTKSGHSFEMDDTPKKREGSCSASGWNIFGNAAKW